MRRLHCDVAGLAVFGDAAEDVCNLTSPENFNGTLVIDMTNPLDFSKGMPLCLLFSGTDSLSERVQAKLSDVHGVKCFNTVSNAQMVGPEFEAETPRMWICGDDADAKQQTEAILVELGWPGVHDVGGIESSRYLEALVPLWVRVDSELNTYKHAFTVALWMIHDYHQKRMTNYISSETNGSGFEPPGIL